MNTITKEQPATNSKESVLPQRLHHTARVVKDHETTRRFYEDIIGMPLVATWAEVAQFPEYPGRNINYCHTFYGLADGGALAFFQFAEPDVHEKFKAKIQTAFNHLALAVSPTLQDAIKERLEKAGHQTRFMDHGYCKSLYVSDPDGLTLEFTWDPDDAPDINKMQLATARQTLSRWLAGDLTPNNVFHHR